MTAHVTRSGDQLIATRHLDAGPDLVWEAFTTPEHLATFWGGHHATVSPDSVVVDLRVGGTFELQTHGEDGCSYPTSFRYEIVDPPTRLVFVEARTGLSTEIRLEPRGAGTRVVVHQRRLPVDLRTDQAGSGLAGILERLAVVVAAMADAERR